MLDVRDNPGGYLDTTVAVASQFLHDGLVLYEQDPDGRRTDWPARSGSVALDTPMLVLANAFSASGAEVLAGALQDRKRAQLVGTKIYAKGSVDTFHLLTDGSALYLTIARWYLPSGTLIEGKASPQTSSSNKRR